MRFLAILLCLALTSGLLPAQTKAPTMQEKIVLIPVGALVEVKLKDKRKLRGRMGAATAQGFSIQFAQNDKIASEDIAFSAVKSVKELEIGMSSATKIVLGAIAGAGALIFILLAIFVRD